MQTTVCIPYKLKVDPYRQMPRPLPLRHLPELDPQLIAREVAQVACFPFFYYIDNSLNRNGFLIAVLCKLQARWY